MKKLLACLLALAAIIVLASLLSACATPVAARPVVASPPVAPMDPAAYFAAAAPTMGPVPPARPEPYGPPGNWAWLHTPPLGCERGPYALIVANDTDNFFVLQMDGVEVQVRGSMGTLPHLPPRTRAYMCVTHNGMHNISGVAYAPRMGVLQEVDGALGRFTWNGRIVPTSAGDPYLFTINHVLLDFN